MHEDYDFDDLTKETPKKKRNSKRKGKDGELLLIKILNKRFDPLIFSRTIGSGNRWGSIAYVSKDYIGDIVCPDNFKFSLECKFGYDIDLHSILNEGSKLLDGFLKQAEDDAKRSNKDALLCYKKDRQPWIAFLNSSLLDVNKFSYYLRYKEYVGITLDTLLEFDNDLFFNHS